ncbi:MAG: T9SS type A sorting domain-containing protein, partial [Bacteroidota bacterium]
DICVGVLRDSRCDYGPGPYSLCGLFKADYVFSDAYIFNFTSQTDGMTYTSDAQASTFLTLSNVDGLGYNDTYDVAIQSVYDLAESDGDIVTVVVNNDEPCTVEISDVPETAMAEEDNSTNAGPQFLGNYIEVDNFVCGASSYTWRFTRTDITELPVEYNTGSPTTLLRISDVLTEAAAGGTFDVEVKPEFDNGQVTSYAGVEELAIIGIAGAQGDIVSAANNFENAAQRVEEAVVAEAAIYPNPNTGDFINVNVTNIPADVEVVNVIVRDLQGRAVQSEQFTVAGNSLIQVMDIDLASGMYVVSIEMNDNVITEKLQVAK